MSTFAAALLSFLLLYKYWALLVIFFFSALVLPLPTSTVLLAAGAFASQGYFSAIIVFFAAFLGNVLGDVTSYVIWRKYGRSVIRERYANKYRFFVKLEKNVNAYAVPTVFASRFVGVFGPIVNFLCGYSRVSFRLFLIGSISGNAVDTLWPVVLGYIVGSYWESFSSLVGVVGAIIAILAVTGVLVRVYFRKK